MNYHPSYNAKIRLMVAMAPVSTRMYYRSSAKKMVPLRVPKHVSSRTGVGSIFLALLTRMLEHVRRLNFVYWAKAICDFLLNTNQGSNCANLRQRRGGVFDSPAFPRWRRNVSAAPPCFLRAVRTTFRTFCEIVLCPGHCRSPGQVKWPNLQQNFAIVSRPYRDEEKDLKLSEFCMPPVRTLCTLL